MSYCTWGEGKVVIKKQSRRELVVDAFFKALNSHCISFEYFERQDGTVIELENFDPGSHECLMKAYKDIEPFIESAVFFYEDNEACLESLYYWKHTFDGKVWQHFDGAVTYSENGCVLV